MIFAQFHFDLPLFWTNPLRSPQEMLLRMDDIVLEYNLVWCSRRKLINQRRKPENVAKII